MADIELVVKIEEERYNQIKRCADNYLVSGLELAVKNGIPLPKGHGDLIDRGELKTHFIGTEQGTDLEVYLEPTIINAPTIIGADTESEEAEND